MLRLMTDEDVPKSIVRGLRQRQPDVDIVRVQEVELAETEDAIILAWAASQSRVLITRDRQTMIGSAYERVRSGQPMPGLIVLHEQLAIGEAIEQILMTAVCCTEAEMQHRVVFLPL
jgi:predicted nuclease of predicted toxin-antitoxin system